MVVLRVGPLPGEALAAAAEFHARVLPRALAELESAGDGVTLIFEPADHTHSGWRLALIQGLAREHAPKRVNALAGDDEAALAAAARYLASAGGVTGQLLPVDGNGAGHVLTS